MFRQIPLQYLCSAERYHFFPLVQKEDESEFKPTTLKELCVNDLCSKHLAKSVNNQDLRNLPEELVSNIFEHMTNKNLLEPDQLLLFRGTTQKHLIIQNRHDAWFQALVNTENNSNGHTNILFIEIEDPQQTPIETENNQENQRSEASLAKLILDNIGKFDFLQSLFIGIPVIIEIVSLLPPNLLRIDLTLTSCIPSGKISTAAVMTSTLTTTNEDSEERFPILEFNDSLYKFSSTKLHSVTLLILASYSQTAQLVFQISKLPNLIFLDLSGNKKVTDVVLNSIEAVQTLLTLDLSGCQVTYARALQLASSLPRLKFLGTFSIIKEENAEPQRPLEIASRPNLIIATDHPLEPKQFLKLINLNEDLVPGHAGLRRFYFALLRVYLFVPYLQLHDVISEDPNSLLSFIKLCVELMKDNMFDMEVIIVCTHSLWGLTSSEQGHMPNERNIALMIQHGLVKIVANVMKIHKYLKVVVTPCIGLLTMLCCNNSKAQSEFVNEDIVDTLEAILNYFHDRKKIVKFVFGALIQLTPQTRASRHFADHIKVEKLGRLIQSKSTNLQALLIFKLRKWYLILRGLVIFLNSSYATSMDAISISIMSSFIGGTLNWGNSQKLSLACLLNITYHPVGALVNSSTTKPVQDIANLIMNNPTDYQIHHLCLGILVNLVYANISSPASSINDNLKSTGALQLVTNILNSFSAGDGHFKYSILTEYQCALILSKLLIHSKERMQLQGILQESIKSRESQTLSRIEPEPSTENSNNDLNLNFTPSLRLESLEAVMTLVWSCEIPLVYYWSASLIAWLSGQGRLFIFETELEAEYKKPLMAHSMLAFYLAKLQAQPTPFFMSQDSEKLHSKIEMFAKVIQENLNVSSNSGN